MEGIIARLAFAFCLRLVKKSHKCSILEDP
jgi:hypothetical protein